MLNIEIHIPKVSNRHLIPNMIPKIIKLVIIELRLYGFTKDSSLKENLIIKCKISNNTTNAIIDSTIANP